MSSQGTPDPRRCIDQVLTPPSASMHRHELYSIVLRSRHDISRPLVHLILGQVSVIISFSFIVPSRTSIDAGSLGEWRHSYIRVEPHHSLLKLLHRTSSHMRIVKHNQK
ncbi:hypothetical protein K505DRAFT_124106 [Melanomma pulvis-pyrius CBS 109.77]|uniref:Uncharacterized protein n=1 Tax=Melanomma pulvis-pyrius CBS 109.77 TaxID=1314802 RepID=A0A6A6WUJ6_9PLEO|nr:hypothetical protein K505DRAFT_124106 [Melanomma pulvis-pyrius CBS 109.77]